MEFCLVGLVGGFLFQFNPYCSFLHAWASWVTQEDSSVEAYFGLMQFAIKELFKQEKV